MIGTTIETQGTLEPDGRLILDDRPAMPPGRVRVSLRQMVDEPNMAERLPDAPWLDDSIPAPFDLPRMGVIVARPTACVRRAIAGTADRIHGGRDVIYETPNSSEALSQGDLLDDCPILFWEDAAGSTAPESGSTNVRAVVLTQACDLAQAKATRVLVAVVHRVQHLVERGILQSKVIRDHVRTHRVFGWYFLPAGDSVEESIVDLRDLHTLPRSLLDNLVQQGKRIARIRTPFREHLAQHFSTTYARIGLPEPYPSQPDS